MRFSEYAKLWLSVVASQWNKVGVAALMPDPSLETLLMESFHDAIPAEYRLSLEMLSVVNMPPCVEHKFQPYERRPTPESDLVLIEVGTDYQGFRDLARHATHMRITVLVCARPDGNMGACLSAPDYVPNNLLVDIEWQQDDRGPLIGWDSMPPIPLSDDWDPRDYLYTGPYALLALQHLSAGRPLLGACYRLGVQAAEDQCHYSEYKCIAISHQSPRS